MPLNMKSAVPQTRPVEVDMSFIYGEGAGFILDVLAMPSHGTLQALQDNPKDYDVLKQCVFDMVIAVRDLEDEDGKPITTIEELFKLTMPFQVAAVDSVRAVLEASGLSPKLSVK